MQRSPVEKMNRILFNQFLYMDKSVLYVYGVLICLEIMFMILFKYIGVDTKEIITFCMVGSGILSIAAIIVLDKMFFGKMAELGASCYFSTKQSIAAFMLTVEIRYYFRKMEKGELLCMN